MTFGDLVPGDLLVYLNDQHVDYHLVLESFRAAALNRYYTTGAAGTTTAERAPWPRRRGGLPLQAFLGSGGR